MHTQHSTMIIGEGPFAGWEFVAGHIEHDIDAMDDLYTVELWPPDADQPAHSFETYRHAYGWTVITAALSADGWADEQMQAALDWWTASHTTTAYGMHRILVAVDDSTWATRGEIAHRLRLGITDLQPGTPYGDALATAERLRLLTWHNQPRPYVALTPDGYQLIHPDDQQAGHASQQRLTAALAADHSPQQPAQHHPAGRAFPPIDRVAAQPGPPRRPMSR
jgi:hypothetical protein